jgi:hypothetical protein
VHCLICLLFGVDANGAQVSVLLLRDVHFVVVAELASERLEFWEVFGDRELDRRLEEAPFVREPRFRDKEHGAVVVALLFLNFEYRGSDSKTWRIT